MNAERAAAAPAPPHAARAIEPSGPISTPHTASVVAQFAE